jgi:hypothetical protein
MRPALSNAARRAKLVRRERLAASRPPAFRRRLAIESLEPRVVLAAPVAVDDTLYFAGFIERNVAEGRRVDQSSSNYRRLQVDLQAATEIDALAAPHRGRHPGRRAVRWR